MEEVYPETKMTREVSGPQLRFLGIQFLYWSRGQLIHRSDAKTWELAMKSYLPLREWGDFNFWKVQIIGFLSILLGEGMFIWGREGKIITKGDNLDKKNIKL